MKSGVYQILNLINNKRYIGSSVNLIIRERNHFRELKQQYHHNIFLQRAYNKYGKENIKFEILLYCSKEDLIFFEQRAINAFNKKELYNLRKEAQNNIGLKHSESTKNKISESHKGIKNPNYNKKVSDETRKKLSDSHKGRTAWNRGLKLSIETKIKISKAKKGENHPLWGKKHSSETKLKISNSLKGKSKGENNPMFGVHLYGRTPMLGKKHSEETRLKMSEAKKLYWKNKRAGKNDN